jgi:hypothetical protein
MGELDLTQTFVLCRGPIRSIVSTIHLPYSILIMGSVFSKKDVVRESNLAVLLVAR